MTTAQTISDRAWMQRDDEECAREVARQRMQRRGTELSRFDTRSPAVRNMFAPEENRLLRHRLGLWRFAAIAEACGLILAAAVIWAII